MKTRNTKKVERRLAFRGWRRHIGASERTQFEEGRKKVKLTGLSDAVSSSSPESDWPNPSRQTRLARLTVSSG